MRVARLDCACGELC